MSALDKIIESIKSEAEARAAATLRSAKAEAARITAEMAESTELECEQIVAQGREEALMLDKIASSNAELKGSMLMLEVRQEIISQILSDALAHLRSLDADEYFAVLTRLAVSNAEQGEGEILLSQEDKARLPQNFCTELNAQLKPGCTLCVAHDTVQTGGGLVLRYGGVEINCTFESLIEDKREQLGDRLSKAIFG